MTTDQQDPYEVLRRRLESFEVAPEPGSFRAILKKSGNGEVHSIAPRKRSIYVYLAAACIAVLCIVSVTFFFYTKRTTGNTAAGSSVKTNTNSIPTDPSLKKPVPVATKEVAPVENTKPENTNPKKEPEKYVRNAPAPFLVVIYSGDTKKEITMPDSSHIVLNKNSKISFNKDFSGGRNVSLEGEAFFEVKKGKEKFTIRCSLSAIEVLGTSFNVISGKNTCCDEVSVISGKVAFYNPLIADHKLILEPGEKGFADIDKNISRSFITDDNFISWKDERLVFKRTALGDVILSLENYFSVPIKITNEALRKCVFTGTFNKPDLHQILEVLSGTFDITYHFKENSYYIEGKGCNN
jgi:hypothetical protein